MIDNIANYDGSIFFLSDHCSDSSRSLKGSRSWSSKHISTTAFTAFELIFAVFPVRMVGIYHIWDLCWLTVGWPRQIGMIPIQMLVLRVPHLSGIVPSDRYCTASACANILVLCEDVMSRRGITSWAIWPPQSFVLCTGHLWVSHFLATRWVRQTTSGTWMHLSLEFMQPYWIRYP